MNQILSTENTKNKKRNKGTPIEIKSIIKFFAIAIMFFGIVLVGEGSYAVYRNIDDKKPENIPYVTIGRINDTAILHVEHNVQISKITYYWDDGEDTVIPIGDIVAQEEITLLGYDSILHIRIEDINGKRIDFQKQYILNGVDITKPQIEIDTNNGSDQMTITAQDETAISYLSYQWEGEEPVNVEATEENKLEIKEQVTLTSGIKKIKIIAEDMNGNVEQVTREIQASIARPEMAIIKDGNEIYIEVKDKDGVKNVTINLNGTEYKTDVNLKEAKLGPLTLKQGNNTISIKITNVNELTQEGTTEIQYTP